MSDSIIYELFPEKSAENPDRNYNSENAPLANDLFDAPPDYYRTVLDFNTGTYDLSILESYYLAYALPSAFAQDNLLYLQLLASDLTSKKHFTKRSGLSSYLCAQTFYGRGALIYDGQEYALEPGDVFLIDCMQPHEYHAASEEGWGYRIIHFNGAMMPGLFKKFQDTKMYVFHFSEQHVIYQYTKNLFLSRKKCLIHMELDEHALLTSLVMEMLKQLPVFTSTALPERIIAVRRYLNAHCTEPLTLDEIAAHFHVSKYYLSRSYKKHTGETIFQYVTQCRMEIATYMLVNSRETIEHISECCGFTETNSFFFAFRRHTGVSPTGYRRVHSREG